MIDNSGTSSKPITFTDYETGAMPTFSNPGVQWGHAVDIRASWVIIDHFFAQNAHEAGIFIASCSNNNIVRNSEITQAGSGVMLNGQYNLITGNYAHDLTMIVNTSGGDDDYGAVEFWIYAPNNEISYNRCYNCKASSYDYGFDGGTVEIYTNGDNSHIHQNWSENSQGFFEVGGGSAQNVGWLITSSTTPSIWHACTREDRLRRPFRVSDLKTIRPSTPMADRCCCSAFAASVPA